MRCVSSGKNPLGLLAQSAEKATRSCDGWRPWPRTAARTLKSLDSVDDVWDQLSSAAQGFAMSAFDDEGNFRFVGIETMALARMPWNRA